MTRDTSDQTLRLDESTKLANAAGRLAIRWLTPGIPSAFQVLDEARITIGRGPGVTLALAAAGLSRCHVEIYRQGPAVIAHDLGSTNGTFVNGKREEYAPLAEGDVLRLGDVVGVVARTGTGASPDEAGVDVLGPDLAFGPGLALQIAELRRAAPSDLPLLIVGETGVGKEYVAHAAHHLSGRSGKLYAVNCAAVPAALAEAELFGHSRGAFTGAEHAALGHLRAAHGGTLFLDELAELPLPVQAKLLRVLQDGLVTPLGETRPHPVDLRIVGACQQPPEQLVAGGRLRQDLAARLAGVTIAVPPLRGRRSDIAFFFRRFLDRYGRAADGRTPEIDPRLLECLLLHHWPGNVRELDLLTRRLLALHGHEPVLRRSHLPAEMNQGLPPPNERVAGPPRSRDRDEHDRRRLGDELRRHGNNVTRAAAAAGLSRSRAYRVMGDRSPAQFLAELAAVKTER
jgi:transcriptional regulator of acetoin/glycerol metabolism